MKLRNKFSGMGLQYHFSPTRAVNPAQGDLDVRAIEGWVGFKGQILHLVALPQADISKEKMRLNDRHCFEYFVTVQPRKRKYESVRQSGLERHICL